MITYDVIFEKPFIVRIGEEQDYLFCFGEWVFLSFKPLRVINNYYGIGVLYEYPLNEVENFSEVQIAHVSHRFALIYKADIPYLVVLSRWGELGVAKLNFLQGKDYKIARKRYDLYLFFEKDGSIRKLHFGSLMSRIV